MPTLVQRPVKPARTSVPQGPMERTNTAKWIKVAFGGWKVSAWLIMFALVLISPSIIYAILNLLDAVKDKDISDSTANWLFCPSVIGFILYLVSSPVFVICFWTMMVLLWQQVQDGKARASTLQVILFMFIPFFNFYWIFVATVGLAQELNRVSKARKLKVELADEAEMKEYAVLVLCTMIPILGILAFVASIFSGMKAFQSAMNVAIAIASQPVPVLKVVEA